MNTAAQGAGNLWLMLLFAVGIIFVMISSRSQKKREEQRQSQINALQKGDQIILPGGVVGSVAGFKDNALEVKIAENVKITVLKSGIIGVLPKQTPIKQGGAK